MTMWQEIGTGRWSWTADRERHLLLRLDGGRMLELHDRTVHVFEAPAGPLDSPRHLRTVAAPELAAVDDDHVWDALAPYGEG